MADSRPNIPLTKNTKTDLYAALNAQVGFPAVAVGAQISAQNLGSSTIRLQAKATEPLSTDGFDELAPGNDVFANDAGDSGAWAESLVIDGLIQVKVV